MHYVDQPFIFILRKILRYFKLYGLSKTFIKIKGQYHMNRIYKTLPNIKIHDNDSHIGIIGCGNYAFTTIAYYANKRFHNKLRACMDVDINKAISLYDHYKLQYYTDKPEDLLNDSKIDLIYISSNHASHAEYAIQALNAGKNVHIEKPHVVSMDQLIRLCDIAKSSEFKINLGFNRPFSKTGELITRYLSSQNGPMMLNWFIAGHEIDPDHWYFKKEEGGRVLGNLCHWIDFVYRLIPEENRYPIQIIPARDKKSDCDIAVSYIFGDGSIAAITFSAKGHTFEGVRERFSAHRGNVLISMDDFKNLTVEVVNKKYRFNQLYRNHGHENCILNSNNMTKNLYNGYKVEYIWGVGELMLKTKDALESNSMITIDKLKIITNKIHESP